MAPEPSVEPLVAAAASPDGPMGSRLLAASLGGVAALPRPACTIEPAAAGLAATSAAPWNNVCSSKKVTNRINDQATQEQHVRVCMPEQCMQALSW